MLDTNRPILWLINGHEQYGLQRAMANLALRVRDRGYPVIIASLAEGDCVSNLAAEGLDVRVLDLPKPPNFKGSIPEKLRKVVEARRYYKRYIPVLADKLSEWSPQVVHWMSPNLTGLAPPVVTRLGALPVWEVPNVIGTRTFGMGARMAARACRKHHVLVLCNSGYTASALANTSLSPHVFYLAADEDRFDPQRVEPIPRAELGIPDDAIVLGIVARLDASKGQLVLLETLERLRGTRDDLHLVCVGGDLESDFAKQLKDYAHAHDLEQRLHLPGFTRQPQRYYGLIDIPVNAQIHPPEAFGLSVVEAMMMGRPVLVHALGGPAETVLDGQTGWHVHSPDVEAWRAGIERVLDDRERWSQMGQAARQHALENFTCQGQADRYLAHLEAALADRV